MSRVGSASHVVVACVVASLWSFGTGCRENRKSETMPAHDSPTTPSPAAAAGKLTEMIDKAAAGQVPAPHFRFQRGHELSGITDFEVKEDGSYALSRTSRKGGAPVAYSGTLEVVQRQQLFGALSRAAILSIPPSTRNIGDDEQPISVTLDGAGDRFILTIWAGDARDNQQFSAFATELYALLDQLSGGTIQLRS